MSEKQQALDGVVEKMRAHASLGYLDRESELWSLRQLPDLLDEYEKLKSDAARHRELTIQSMKYERGEPLEIVASGDLVSIFAHCLAEQFEHDGGVNYVEYTVTHERLGPLILSMRRKLGKEPSELVTELKREVEQLKQELREAKAE